MQNGLYVATSGMLMQQNRVDTISNNLANMNNNGFKRDRAVFSVFRPDDKRYPQNFIRETHYNKTINTAVLLHENSANFEMGPIKETGNTFDFAIKQENAFFAIDTPWGIRYTRDGAFTLNENGELVTAEGYHVMSRNAQGTANIVIDQNARFEVDKTGTIYANGIAGDRLMIVEFDKNDLRQLQKVGRNQFAAVDIEPMDADNAGVRQGYVEGANVDPIAEMVRMIDASRGYEMYAKVVQTHDEISQKAASQILTQ
ncbi:MAG: flagellar basal-body rod protein FlgF [Mucispirillum sp.]|nr:flagellar basal-body rod protein FlgF [Mucispirillum sp.]